MKNQDERIAEEAAALWREMFGAAPPPATDGKALLRIITGALPDVRYERIRSPHLRPSQITGPRRRGASA